MMINSSFCSPVQDLQDELYFFDKYSGAYMCNVAITLVTETGTKEEFQYFVLNLNKLTVSQRPRLTVMLSTTTVDV